MSDIPRARSILEAMLDARGLRMRDRKRLHEALALMTRKKPRFKTRHELRALTMKERRHAQVLRRRGHSMNSISQMLHTNIGRVSEAINDGAIPYPRDMRHPDGTPI